MIDEILRHNIVILIGDFNAKVGESREDVEKVVGLFTSLEEEKMEREWWTFVQAIICF